MKRKTFIKIIAGLTIIANTPSLINKGLLAFLIDATFGTAINVLLLVVVFKVWDWITNQVKSITKEVKESDD